MARMKSSNNGLHLTPTQLAVGGFALIIIVGLIAAVPVMLLRGQSRNGDEEATEWPTLIVGAQDLGTEEAASVEGTGEPTSVLGPTSTVPPSEPQVHVVQPGETL